MAVPAASLTETSLTDTAGTGVLSVMVPIPEAEPIINGTVSAGSTCESTMVGTITLKLLTPSGTVRVPPTKVTPLVKVAVE